MHEDFEQIAGAIKRNKSFAIFGHVHTDFDSICSCLAMKAAIEGLGKRAHVFINSAFPPNVTMLDGYEKINCESQKTPYDIAIVLDCNNESRLGKYNYRYKRGVKGTILIDHHKGTLPFAKFNYLDSRGSSTCELVYNLFQYMGIVPNKVMCKLLVAGIYTDTGSLMHTNCYPSTYRAVARLVELGGFSIDEITVPIFKNLSLAAFKLKALCYERVKLLRDDKIAITVLTKEDFESCGATFEETTGLIDVTSQLSTVRLIALASEDPSDAGTFYVSLRSKGDYSAYEISKEFGGGGHIQAAGCKLIGDAKEIEKKLIAALEKELDRV